jgi:hypothetical protein
MAAVDMGSHSAENIKAALEEFIAAAVRENGGSTTALNPGHRVRFHWPPHPISYKYHVLQSDWTGRGSFTAHGESFEVKVARTPHGVFGRCETLWHEAKGESLDDVLAALARDAEPLFTRQFSINKTLGRPGRFTGHICDLPPADLIKLLYCTDRDVANEARTEIETHASSRVFFPALITVLRDDRHPYRRSAQWCVLDLFEDLPSYASGPEEEQQAVDAMRDLLWNATDDYARTMYKAGVVLGGHLPDEHGGPVLLECLKAPSKIGRRAAIHGLFHVVEWHPESRAEVVSGLREMAASDPEPVLREYAGSMANDIESGNYDHVPEPAFPEEEA